MVYGEEDRIDILRFAFTEEVPLTRINRISSSLVQLSSPNLLPSGIKLSGVESWVRELAREV